MTAGNLSVLSVSLLRAIGQVLPPKPLGVLKMEERSRQKPSSGLVTAAAKAI